MTVFVLWENHAIGPIEKFGPHDFLTACVAQHLGVDRFMLRRSRTISGRSCGGNSNVLRELEEGPGWDIAPHLIAVLDTDKLHDLLRGEPRKLIAETAYDAWAAEMAAKCRARIGTHDVARLTFGFLDRNIETLMKVLGDDLVEKDVLRRDSLLQKAAADPVLIRRALDEMPTWAALVETVARRL
jgi:hypothetical protein